MDSLEIRGIRAYGYTGFFPEEQQLGQWFEVDLTLWLDLALAGETDELAHTFDYSMAVQAVQQLIQTVQFRTIEGLATEIAQTLLQSPQISQLKVRLTKCHPPIPNFSGQVTIEIIRP
jgi:dihydroneopterin aldolase